MKRRSGIGNCRRDPQVDDDDDGSSQGSDEGSDWEEEEEEEEDEEEEEKGFLFHSVADALADLPDVAAESAAYGDMVDAEVVGRLEEEEEDDCDDAFERLVMTMPQRPEIGPI
jgi:hypothetical protein